MSGWSDWGSISGSLPSPSEASGPGQDASLGEGASPSGCHEGSEGGGGHIYPQVRLLNRIWRWMDVDSREEITGLS